MELIVWFLGPVTRSTDQLVDKEVLIFFAKH